MCVDSNYLPLEVVLLVELCPVREGFLLPPLVVSSLLLPGRTLTVKGLKSVTQLGMKSLQSNKKILINRTIFSMVNIFENSNSFF